MIGAHQVTPDMLAAGAARIAALTQRRVSANQRAGLKRRQPLTSKGLPMFNRHPVILELLDPLLPPGARKPDTRLARDLRIGDRADLAVAVEEAWNMPIDRRDVPAWRTLGDVCTTIADALAAQAT